MTNLTNLEVLDYKIRNYGVKSLTNLASLRLGNNRISGRAIQKMSNLKSLYFSMTCYQLETEIFWSKALLNLTKLSLESSDTINDTVLSKLTNLTSLTLGDERCTNAGLGSLTNLSELCLSMNGQITKEGLLHLNSLTSLYLLYNAKITDDGIIHLTTLTNLDISYRNIHGADTFETGDEGIKI